MRVLLFAPSFEPAVNAGGPARSLTNLVRESADHHDIVVITSDRDLGAVEPFPGLSGRRVTRGRATTYYVDLHSVAHWRSILRKLTGREFDLILLNSVWHGTLAILPATLSLAGLIRGPVVLMPRGELEPGALAHKGSKKRIAGPLARRLYRASVAAVGTTSDSEATNAAEWFPSNPIIRTRNSPDAIDFGVPDRPSDALRILVVGRVHPHKGLLPLLRGLRLTTGRMRVVVVGLAEDQDYWSECQSAVRSLGPNIEFDYKGSVTRTDVPPLLWNSDCLALLTAGENYCHVIAESLQSGCPVITTPPTPWTEVIRDGGGEIIQDREDPHEVASVFDRWAAKSPDELASARLEARSAFETFDVGTNSNIIDQAIAVLGLSSAGNFQPSAE